METTSSTYQSGNPTGMDNDNELRHLARKRVAFKSSLTIYLIMSAFFVVLWYFTSGGNSYFWPVWPILGWGLGIVIQYFSAYHGSTLFSTEREYEKLKNQQNR